MMLEGDDGGCDVIGEDKGGHGLGDSEQHRGAHGHLRVGGCSHTGVHVLASWVKYVGGASGPVSIAANPTRWFSQGCQKQSYVSRVLSTSTMCTTFAPVKQVVRSMHTCT